MARQHDLNSLYELFTTLKERLGGFERLSDSNLGPSRFPDRGVYFFFAKDEIRSSGTFPRLTRVGTHACLSNSSRSIWDRLREHRGSTRGKYAGGGNHRASSFRKEVGGAFIERDGLHNRYPEWYEGNSTPPELRQKEQPLEERVSSYIRELPFLWVEVDDPHSTESDRAFLERNITALVSNFEKPSIDTRSDDWLGYQSPNETISGSELWCVNHVTQAYDPEVLDRFEYYLAKNHSE